MSKPDPYQLHRIALGPLLPGVADREMVAFCQQAATVDQPEFLAFLHQQGLSPLWGKLLENSEAACKLPEEFGKAVHQARMQATGNYLIQRQQLETIKRILEEVGIGHAVYKGAHTREVYYNEPALRPAVDIDILVPGEEKIAAIQAFQQHGFEFYATPDNISHEANLVKGKTSVDLHWDILRPGRTRRPMIDALLEARRDYGSHWGMSEEANLLVMLAHPVFAKYSTTPQATLMRTVDLALALDKTSWELTKLIQLLDTAGLRTAAWLTLMWLKLLTNSTLGDRIIEEVKPGTLKQRYLGWWLEENLATRLLDKPALVQLGFTLPAHDKLTDTLRAIRLKRQADRNAAADLLELENISPG